MIENNNMDTNKEISSSVSQQYSMNASLSNTSSTPGANIIPSTSNPVTTDGKHPFSASQPSLTSMDYDDDYEKRVNKQRGIVNYTSSYHADIEEGADTNGTGRSFFVNRDDNDDFDVNNNRSKMSFVFSNIRIILVSFFLCVIGFICLVVAIAVKSNGEDYSMPFFVISALTLIPGIYSIVVIIGASTGNSSWKRSLANLPNFRDVF